MDTPPLVSVVDDDESVRESLPDLLKEFGFAARTFSSAEEFLISQRELTHRRQKIPSSSSPLTVMKLSVRA